MRKLFITGVVLCSAIILIGAQTGFAGQLMMVAVRLVMARMLCRTQVTMQFPHMQLQLVPYVMWQAETYRATSKCIDCHPCC